MHDYNLISKHHIPPIQTRKVLHDFLPTWVTDHMPICLHLDLPTSLTSTPKTCSQSFSPRTLYHSKRLEDVETKEAFA